FEVESRRALEQRDFRIEAGDRFLMTMAMQQRTRFAFRRREPGRLAREKLVEHERVRADRFRGRITGEERAQLVAEGEDAARLEPDYRNSARRAWTERRDDLAKPNARAIEHSLIVERPAAAKLLVRNRNAKAGAFEYFDSGGRDLRLNEIGERV